jgi:hypothetical protein
MRIELLDSAEKDLLDGFEFYERQSEGLGDYFIDSLFSDIESLHLYAGIHTLHFGYHRLLSKRFPFATACGGFGMHQGERRIYDAISGIEIIIKR